MKKIIFLHLKLFLWLVLCSINYIEYSHASEDCGLESPGLTNEFKNTVSSTAIWDSIAPCVAGAGKGVWASTGGRVSDSFECLSSPFDCVSNVAEGFRGAYNGIKELVKQNPLQLMGLPFAAVGEVICEIAAGVFTDVGLAMLSGGAASAALAMSLAKAAKILGLLPKLAEMAKLVKGSLKGLTSLIKDLTGEQLEKLKNLMGTEAGAGRFKSALVSCGIAG